MANSKYLYDVFLSHNSADKPVVESIATRLQGAGVTPFLDRWCLVPGKPWQEELEAILENSAACAVFLGSNGLGPWQNVEMRVALDRRVHEQDFHVVPALLPGKKPALPLFLRQLTYVEFQQPDDPEAFRLLLAGIKGKLSRSTSQGWLPDQAAITWLAIKLERGNSEERNQAARQFGALKNPAAISILDSRWSEEPDATVRYWLANALGEIGGEQAIAALHRIKANELNAFAQLGIDEALEAATERAD